MLRQDINLYQASFRQQAPLLSAVVMAQSLAAVAVVMLLTYGYAWQEVSGMQAELQIVVGQESAAIARLEKLGPLIKSITGEESVTAQLNEALRTLETKQDMLTFVNSTELGDRKGFSHHLKSLATQSIDGLWLTQITLSGTGEATRLRGRAQRPELVPSYVQGLATEQAFAAQRFQQFVISRPDDNGGDIVDFSMSSEPFDSTGLAAAQQ
jgi:hypothetical protein